MLKRIVRKGRGRSRKTRRRIWLLVFTILLILFWKSLPDPLFKDPSSTVLYDRNGELLGARIASDGQWRFPGVDSLPGKYLKALILFEDRYFKYHPGVNPVSIFRALGQNIKAGEIRSGGSTITMQVLRMARKNRARNLGQKTIEAILALRLELSESKQDILILYADNAPFGGNVVGIEAASWRYFGTGPHNLTWSEAALLAVLPNAPSLIHPGKNRDLLLEKRNRLLDRLFEEGEIDELTCSLAKEEALPEKPLPLPNLVPHVADALMLDGSREPFISTIDKTYQSRVNELLANRQQALMSNEIHNMACLVMEVESGEVLAYAGNAVNGNGEHGESVDIIPSLRSSGSILKPFLFAAMLDNGDLLQGSLIPDVPVRYNGYAPKNYDRGYEGAVPAYEALERSLNIPSVIMLKRYGVGPFLDILRKMGFTSFSFSPEHYGLTLILGGAEVSLWELAGMYGSMARVLNHYTSGNGYYYPSDYHMPTLEKQFLIKPEEELQEEGLLSASSIYFTFNSLLEVNRPEELSMWYLMSSSRKIAWKTGTSYGFRDAWAVGVSPDYVVACWAGNADGEGRTGLSGVQSAAPLLFDVFSILPETAWFDPPLDDMAEATVCAVSGYLAGPDCPVVDSVLVVPKGKKSKSCPYHKKIHLDESGKYRVSSSCYPVHKMKTKAWFVLPPLMEWYFKQTKPSYKELPPVMPGCIDEAIAELEIVYPEWDSHLVIPRELDGTKGKVVLEVAHRNERSKVYWHIDQEYIATTRDVHELALDIKPGEHLLTVIDEAGNQAKVRFEVLK